MEGLKAHLGEGGQSGHHNSAISRWRFRRAGASGGGREGRPRQSRIMRARDGSSIAARIRIRPPQRGHSSTSTAKILAISWDQKHNLTFNWTYELPFGRNTHGVMAALVKGWQLNNITSVNSGPPFTA